MKRVLSIFCAVLLVFSLCSCGGVKNNSSDANSEISSTNGISSIETDTTVNGTSKDNSKTESSSNQNGETNNSSNGLVSNGSSKPSDLLSGNDDEIANNCTHDFAYVGCGMPRICKICGAEGKISEHFYSKGVCTKCGIGESTHVDWYDDNIVKITKSEIDQIFSMNYKKPKNIIFMIGDGMGPNDIKIAEKLSNDRFDFGLVLNQFKNVGEATTHANNSAVTDSAASGTALATGYKTNTGYVGVSPTGERLTNISEIARQEGKKVGIVTNDLVVGATPSAFCVHNISRKNYFDLAKSFVDFKPDVLIGRNSQHFDDLNLSAFTTSKNIQEKTSILDKNTALPKPLLGFFDNKLTSLPKANYSLAYGTQVALNRLKNNDKGFFLMVENALTDFAGAANDMQGKINGVVIFDRAVAVALKFIKENPDTLLIVTSDHETGGVQILTENFTLNNVEFTTTGHTDTKVKVFAAGYGAEYFNNKVVDNTDIAKFAINAVKGN